MSESLVLGNIYMVCHLSDNNAGSPLADKLVRQAVNCALDRDELCVLAPEGEGYGTSILMPNGFEGYDESYEIKQDQEKARSLLAEAGYPDGCALTVDYYLASNAFTLLVQAIQTQLAEVGIELDIQEQDLSTLLDKLYGASYDDFNMSVMTCMIPDPTYEFYFNCLTKSSNNLSYYSNPELDELIHKARSTTDKLEKNKLKSFQLNLERFRRCSILHIRISGGKSSYRGSLCRIL